MYLSRVEYQLVDLPTSSVRLVDIQIFLVPIELALHLMVSNGKLSTQLALIFDSVMYNMRVKGAILKIKNFNRSDDQMFHVP